MVEQFRHSGLTRAAYSRKYGVPLATLSWWLARSRSAAKLPVPVMFREVRVSPPLEPPLGSWAMEIISPSGLTVRCREALPVRELARLLRGARW